MFLISSQASRDLIRINGLATETSNSSLPRVEEHFLTSAVSV